MPTTTTNAAVSTNVSSSGRTYITGQSSGLNTQALIAAAVSKATKQQTDLNTQISTNTSKVAAYQKLQSQVTSFETALDALKSSANNADATNPASSSVSSVFDTKFVGYTTSDGSTASNDLTVTADGTAATGTHTVVVTQLAQAQQVTSDTQTSNAVALGYNGTFDINVGSNTAATITVATGDTLIDLKNKINAQSTTTGVSADILQISSGSYKLVLSGSSLNQQINVANVTGDDALTSLGVTDGLGSFNHISQVAQPAQFTFDGTPITGNSNTFNNILTGVNISLQNAAPSTTITVNVSNNFTGVRGAINNLVSAYNSLFDTINANEVVNSDGTVDSSEVLFGDPLLQSLSNQLKTLLVANGNNSSGNNNSLGALGITVGSNNHLAISNQTLLTNALYDNFSEVQSLFATQLTSSDTSLTVGSNKTDLNTSFTIDITTNGAGNVVAASVNGSNDFTINGNQIVGKAGTDYAGLTLVYTGTTGGSISVDLRQGVADRLVNFLDGYNNVNSGLIAKEISSIQNTDLSLQTQIAQIKATSITIENALIAKYAAMETAIGKAKLAQQSINAIFGFTTSTTNAG